MSGSWEKGPTLPAQRVSHGYCPDCFAAVMRKTGLLAKGEAEGCALLAAAGGNR